MGWKFNPFTGKLDVFVGPPTGPAGGDLTGTYPNPTVDGLQGTPVSSATPYNGQVLQFDGTNWVPGSIPSGGSGGGGVVYFLNFNTAADAPVTNIPQTPNTSKELAIAVDTVATSYTSAHLPTASYAFLGSFVTDLNVPSATSIPAGLWDFNIYAQSSTTNVANQVYFKIEVLKYDGVNAPTLISTSGDTYIYDPTEVTQYVSSCIIPSGVTLTATDRLVVYLYGRAHQANKDITFHFGSTYPSHTHSTMPSVTGTGVVKVVNGVFQSPATTIVNADISASAAIDVSKLAMSTNRLLGRTTAGTGAVEQITVGTGLSLSAGTLSSTVTAGVTSVTGTSPIASSGGTTPAISIADAVADGTTKGAAAFNASDFNSASGVISLDYTNGQSASASDKGFLASTDWTTFNNKIGVGAYTTQTGLTMNTARLLGRTTAGSGAAEEITVGTGLSLTGGTLTNTAAGVTSVTATAPLTSSGGATPDISTSIATNRIVGRSTAGTGVMEELTPVGITVSAGNITGIGGTLGTVDNAVPRADGTGGYTAQGSDIIIDDPATGVNGNNIAIRNDHVGQTNSSLVLTPKGTGALIAQKPNGATSGGNARGANAVDWQTNRASANQIAAGSYSVVSGGQSNRTLNSHSVVCGGDTNEAAGSGYDAVVGGQQNKANGWVCFIGGGQFNEITGLTAAIVGGRENRAIALAAIVGGGGGSGLGNTASATVSSILGGLAGLADRYGQQTHASGQFAAKGDAQRARFVMRNKTTTNAAVELFLDGSSTRLTIPSGKSVGGTIQICGTTSGGETANLYIRQFLIRNRGGTTALIGGIQTVGTDIEGITAADVTLTADDTNDSLKVEVTGYTPVTGMTGTASTDLINKVAHGFNNNDDIVFTSLTGGTGLTANTVTYWVINANPDDFQVSATRGGGAVNILTDYTDMTATRVMRWVANVDCTEIGHGT